MARNVLNVYPISDIDGIAASQTPNAGNLTINGALADNGTVQFASSHLIIIASSGDDSSRSFTIEGKDSRGISMIETISGANAGNAVTTNYFKAVSSISINGSAAASLTVGVDGKAASSMGIVDNVGVSIGFGCEISDTSNLAYSVQHTFDDVTDISKTDFYWFNHETIANKSDSQDGNYAFGIMGVRIITNSFVSGDVKATFIGSER